MPRKSFLRLHLTLLVLVCAVSAAPLMAEEASTADQGEAVAADAGQDVPDLLDSTLSSRGQLLEDERPTKGAFLPFAKQVGAWNKFKSGLQKDHGLSIGGYYGVLYQPYSDSGVGEDYAISQKFAFTASYDLAVPGAADAGSVNIAIEDRRPLGSGGTPQIGGILAGSSVSTAPTWGEFNFGVTQLYWQHNLFENRFQFAVGRLFAPAYLDTYPFFDDNRQFFNQTFSTSPTTPSPLRGLGAVATVYLYRKFYLLGGLYDANSEDTLFTRNDFKSFFGDSEFFYQLEVGWTESAKSGVAIASRGATDRNNIHVTFWVKDKQVERNIPSGWGLAFNANWAIHERVMPFLRGAWSHGDATPTEANLTAGIGYRIRGHDADLLGFGVGWAKPSNSALALNPGADDQYTSEIFYRWQLTPNLAITPSLQAILNPTFNTGTNVLWVGSLRTRVNF